MQVDSNMRVAVLILDQPRHWNVDLLNTLFTESAVKNTRKIHILHMYVFPMIMLGFLRLKVNILFGHSMNWIKETDFSITQAETMILL